MRKRLVGEGCEDAAVPGIDMRQARGIIAIHVAAGLATKFFAKTGTRVFTVLGSLLCGLGVLLLSRMSTDGSYLTDLLPGMLVMSLGAGGVFVANTTAANAGVPPEQAGLAAALLNTGQQLGGALGLAVLTAVATSHTNAQLAAGHAPIDAMNAGFGRALFVGGVIGVVAAILGLWTVNARGDADATASATQPATV
ncbi:MFS transporter [Nocardia amamiensis]|uniref:MFS transporter n=1 Tax=Nocardia amamiensis TaxID=404578 RepID=UPI0008328BCA|nr:MFS transporter [Nocardia amamiensis]